MSEVTAQLSTLVTTGVVPGAQYVACTASGEIEACAAGWADQGLRAPMTLETTLMAYSMTKTVTAIAVLQLVDTGQLDVDARVASLLPDSPYGSDLCVAHLLAHTGGLPNPLPLRWVHPLAAHAAFDERHALANVYRAHRHLSRRPGERYAYSNIGYWMLGAIIERVAGVTFASYVTEHILQRLQIPPQELGFDIVDARQHAAGYVERWSFANVLGRWLIDPALLGGYEHGWRRILPHYPNGPAFGGLIGTARAFARLLSDLLSPTPRLLGERAGRLLYERQRAGGRETEMTLGWHVANEHADEVFFKEGGGAGFHCVMRLHRRRGVGSVLMTNATTVDVKACAASLDAIAFGERTAGRPNTSTSRADA